MVLTLSKVHYATHLFVEHKPTNKKIKSFLSVLIQYTKRLSKIIHIKEDQADISKTAENIVVLQDMNFQKYFFFLN